MLFFVQRKNTICLWIYSESIIAATAFFSTHSARIEKIFSSWDDCYEFQPLHPRSGKAVVCQSLHGQLFTATISQERLPLGGREMTPHTSSLRRVLKGGIIIGAAVGAGGRGFQLTLKSCLAELLVFRAGQMTAYSKERRVLWSHKSRKAAASLQSLNDPVTSDAALSSEALAEKLFDLAKKKMIQVVNKEKKKAQRALEKFVRIKIVLLRLMLSNFKRSCSNLNCI